MKKLLALILCVVMVLSLAPAAFAAYDTADQSVWRGKGQIEDIVAALKTNAQLMYGAIAADTAVYQGIKSVDSLLNDLVDAMMEGYAPTVAGTSQAGSVISDAVIAGLRRTIGGEVSDYLTKHTNDYYVYDKGGNRVLDPAKYAGAFAKALSNAVSSEKAILGIQSYMYYIFQRNAYEQTAQQLADLRADMTSWGNWAKYGFDDLTNAAGNMHMPGIDIDNAVNNIDGTMHGVNAIYQEFLTAEGMLGADLNGDGAWDTGFTTVAPVDIVTGVAVPVTDVNGNNDGKGAENDITAFITGANQGQ